MFGIHRSYIFFSCVAIIKSIWCFVTDENYLVSRQITAHVSRTSLFCSGCKEDEGIAVSDVIVEVGGEQIASCEDVLCIVEQFSMGDFVPMTVMRGESLENRISVLVPLLHDACTSYIRTDVL